MRHSAPQRSHHIMQGRRTQRGHQANAPGHWRQAAFACSIKNSFGFKSSAQLQKLLEQGALPGPAHALYHQLQFPAWLINTDPGAQLHQLPIPWGKIKQACSTPKHGTTQLAAGVFQRKITVPARCPGETTDFAAHQHRVETGIQGIRHGVTQCADLPNSAGRGSCTLLSHHWRPGGTDP